MTRGVRVVTAGLTLAGLLSASALGAVTAIHVDLEHGARHGAAGHDRLSDVSTAAEHTHHPGNPAAKGHAHSHGPEIEAPGTSDPDLEGLRQTPATAHEHVLALAADLDRRAGGSAVGPLTDGTADATRGLVCAALPSPRRQPARASPPARAAPLSRRSVVLQL